MKCNPDDKEEREAMRCCPDCKLRIFVVNGQSEWRCDGCGNKWVKAPKHTDKEYEQLYLDWEGFAELVEAAIQRIEELEANARR